jgi:isopentenyldiphosphate isomerase
MWGEHESKSIEDSVILSHEMEFLVITANKGIAIPTSTVDYIFFIKADVDLEINPNEVRDSKYVTADELRAMFVDPSIKMTPWFKLICETFLFKWWANIDNIDGQRDVKTIQRLGF